MNVSASFSQFKWIKNRHFSIIKWKYDAINIYNYTYLPLECARWHQIFLFHIIFFLNRLCWYYDHFIIWKKKKNENEVLWFKQKEENSQRDDERFMMRTFEFKRKLLEPYLVWEKSTKRKIDQEETNKYIQCHKYNITDNLTCLSTLLDIYKNCEMRVIMCLWLGATINLFCAI